MICFQVGLVFGASDLTKACVRTDSASFVCPELHEHKDPDFAGLRNINLKHVRQSQRERERGLLNFFSLPPPQFSFIFRRQRRQ